MACVRLKKINYLSELQPLWWVFRFHRTKVTYLTSNHLQKCQCPPPVIAATDSISQYLSFVQIYAVKTTNIHCLFLQSQNIFQYFAYFFLFLLFSYSLYYFLFSLPYVNTGMVCEKGIQILLTIVGAFASFGLMTVAIGTDYWLYSRALICNSTANVTQDDPHNKDKKDPGALTHSGLWRICCLEGQELCCLWDMQSLELERFS